MMLPSQRRGRVRDVGESVCGDKRAENKKTLCQVTTRTPRMTYYSTIIILFTFARASPLLFAETSTIPVAGVGPLFFTTVCLASQLSPLLPLRSAPPSTISPISFHVTFVFVGNLVGRLRP
ncbi:hypothetical protein HGRIS_005151 [Hohenbuehelia grisea]|uniref:Transmembrane protein n=1 Tax=Hohenbuehelia grisea TaxID=104357 RepID=A0ABR3JF40_9AGAR